MIKVIIADDQELIRQSLQIVLQIEGNIEVLDAVADGNEVLESIERAKPDVVLMDIRMPGMDGVVCTRVIKEKYPEVKIIILTTFDDDEYVYNALKYGASGYLLKGTSTSELVTAIEKVYNGTAMINEDITSKVVKIFSRLAKSNSLIKVDESQVENLRENEKRIISLIGRGFSNKEIAEELYLSNGTVRNTISNILGKLNLRDRTQLAIWAVQSDVVNNEFKTWN